MGPIFLISLLRLIHALYPTTSVYPPPACGNVKGYVYPLTSFIIENCVITNSNLHKLLGGCTLLLISQNTCKFISLTVALSSLQTPAQPQWIWSKLHLVLYDISNWAKCFKKSEQVCCDTYHAILGLPACSYLILWAVGTTRHLWPSFTASSGHCSSTFMNCFPLLLLSNLSVDKLFNFSSLSALVTKFCYYLTTANKNNCSLCIFSILHMILLGSTAPCPPTCLGPRLQSYLTSFFMEKSISYHWLQRELRYLA